MATILSVIDIIDVGKASIYLSANYTQRQALFGGTVIKPTPPVQIALVTSALEWGYLGGAQTSEQLRQVANYLYWMCGKFQLEAQNVISGSGGGSVAPSSGGSLTPNPLDFIVGVDSFISTLETTVTISQFTGYNVEFDRNGQPQYTTNPGDGSTYYGWNRVTGVFTLYNGAAQDGERFRLVPTI